MAPLFEPRRRKINSSPLFSHPASRMVNLQARLHSGEKLRRQQEKQIAVPRTILHGMGGLRTGEGVGTERPYQDFADAGSLLVFYSAAKCDV